MKNRLIHGVGKYNKGKFKSHDGKKGSKVYEIWRAMIQRCYDEKFHERQPSYKDCTVCNEWHDFQVFADWFDINYPNDGGNYELDKDLKATGNKIYSPMTCTFIDKSINMFLRDSGNGRGKYLIGVSDAFKVGRFRSRCKNPITKKEEQIGTFDTELEAHLAWRKRKCELARQLADIQENEEVKMYLKTWADNLESFKI